MAKKGHHKEWKVVGYTPEGKPIFRWVEVQNSPEVVIPENFRPGQMDTYQLTLENPKKGGKEQG